LWRKKKKKKRVFKLKKKKKGTRGKTRGGGGGGGGALLQLTPGVTFQIWSWEGGRVPCSNFGQDMDNPEVFFLFFFIPLPITAQNVT